LISFSRIPLPKTVRDKSQYNVSMYMGPSQHVQLIYFLLYL